MDMYMAKGKETPGREGKGGVTSCGTPKARGVCSKSTTVLLGYCTWALLVFLFSPYLLQYQMLGYAACIMYLMYLMYLPCIELPNLQITWHCTCVRNINFRDIAQLKVS